MVRPRTEWAKRFPTLTPDDITNLQGLEYVRPILEKLDRLYAQQDAGETDELTEEIEATSQEIEAILEKLNALPRSAAQTDLKAMQKKQGGKE